MSFAITVAVSFASELGESYKIVFLYWNITILSNYYFVLARGIILRMLTFVLFMRHSVM